MRQSTPPGKLQVLGIVFLLVVVAIVSYTNQLIIPLFLGLITWGKAWLKTLTPKLGLLLLKNSVVIQLRRMVVHASAHIFVKSHKPWRRFITMCRLAIVTATKNLFSRYMQMPLWLRTSIAVGVLIATAGSTFAVFALLIVPQPVLEWLTTRLRALLNKLGVTQLFSALWRLSVPAKLRHRWHMYLKWTLGRQQVRAAQRLHDTVINKAVPGVNSLLAKKTELQ